MRFKINYGFGIIDTESDKIICETLTRNQAENLVKLLNDFDLRLNKTEPEEYCQSQHKQIHREKMQKNLRSGDVE